jgi:hypothetical protein
MLLLSLTQHPLILLLLFRGGYHNLLARHHFLLHRLARCQTLAAMLPPQHFSHMLVLHQDRAQHALLLLKQEEEEEEEKQQQQQHNHLQH